MLATFVIGLREGLEAALIVGIVATFLRRHGSSRNLRQMWIGVLVAALLCLAGGIALGHTSLPQRQQEMLETVVGAVAVVMVTFMVLWMKSHSRDLKKELEGSLSAALATGSAVALVMTAFLAVIREGFETAVFLVASFQTTGSTWQTIGGAVIGIAVAVVLGLLIYRGGVRINLSRFFRVTGVVLVVVAAGLVMTVLRHAHEADWLNIAQQPAVDLSGLVRPGSVQESLITGVLGIAAQPTWIEIVAWLLYLVPMLAVVLWPAARLLNRAAAGRLLSLTGVSLLIAAGALAVLVPRPAGASAVLVELSSAGGDAPLSAGTRVVVSGRSAGTLVADFTTAGTSVGTGSVGIAGHTSMEITGAATVDGVRGSSYSGTSLTAVPTGLPATLTGSALSEANGGRLPVGLKVADLRTALPVTYSDTWQPTVVIASDGSVLSASARLIRTGTVTGSTGVAVTVRLLDTQLEPTAATLVRLHDAAATTASGQARHQLFGQAIPGLFGVAGLVFLLVGLPRLWRWTARTPSAAIRTARRHDPPQHDPAQHNLPQHAAAQHVSEQQDPPQQEPPLRDPPRREPVGAPR